MNPYPSSILQPPASSLRSAAPRSAAPRSTLHAPRAFTLIELLVVIAVIALLAALIFPITGIVNRSKVRAKARAELAQVQTAIESYKAKRGHYPPDNAGQPATNQLYYELLGTKQVNDPAGMLYQTLDGSATIKAASLASVFGTPNVAGFVNCTKTGASEEAAGATPFIKALKPGQAAQLPSIAPENLKVLACSVLWPAALPGYYGVPGLNPFRYNSSNPTNNPSTYDLWVDVIIDGKTNRICNWSTQPIIVSQP